ARAERLRRRRSPRAALALLHRPEQLVVEVAEPLESEMALLPVDQRGLANGDHRGLDRERPASAHRIPEWLAPVVGETDEDRRRERLLERRAVRAGGAIAPLVEGLPARVEPDRQASAEPVDDDARRVLVEPPAARRATDLLADEALVAQRL